MSAATSNDPRIAAAIAAALVAWDVGDASGRCEYVAAETGAVPAEERGRAGSGAWTMVSRQMEMARTQRTLLKRRGRHE